MVHTADVERSIAVAVVDGNPGTRKGLSRRLRQISGIVVVGEAGDQEAALRVVHDTQPDVVVMDLRRIAPDGAEFLAKVAAARPQAGIMVLTAYLSERERSDLMQAGARATLFKEIDSETLIRTIRTIAAPPVSGERRSEA